jgi:hypothetical protein
METLASSTAPFHAGEEAVQLRVGVRESIAQWAGQAIRPFMPEQHRAFFAKLPFMVASARDGEGRPWATLLVGSPGFVYSPDPERLDFKTQLLPGDALEKAFVPGAKVGLLGIELDTRRRNRINGTLSNIGDEGFTVTVDQSFGNCPQYISKRFWQSAKVNTRSVKTTQHRQLNAHMQSWIARADTLFIASGYSRQEQEHSGYGMDVSHRGGPAGFVKVASANRLVLPDYAGNNFFNTIGNLLMDARVGLLFVDFERGNLLQISGNATIDWDSREVSRYAGAQRLINVEIDRIVQLDRGLPLRWTPPEGAARELRVLRKIVESEDVTSFEFAARDNGTLPAFKAGQYLPIEVRIKQHESLQRTYSLSNAPGEGRYRISVKREPQGVVSRLLHQQIGPGDTIVAKNPEGEFVLLDNSRPVALISAGIGVTPMVSMLHTLVKGERAVYFIHGARDRQHNPLASEILGLASNNDNVNLGFVFSQPGPDDIEGEHYHRSGRIDASVIEAYVPGLDAEFYLCGPPEFLSNLEMQLTERGVPEAQIHVERF